MFYKSKREIKTEDLKLSDYGQIWTKFCFLDESGSLSNRTEPFFTVGLLKMSMPYFLQIVDLLIGSITYDIKYQNKLVSGDEYKLNLVEYIKKQLGTDTLTKGFRNRNFNIFVEQDN